MLRADWLSRLKYATLFALTGLLFFWGVTWGFFRGDDRLGVRLPVPVEVFGVIVQLAIAGSAAYWLYLMLINPRLRRWKEVRDQTLKQLDQSFANPHAWKREDVAALLAFQETRSLKKEVEELSTTKHKFLPEPERKRLYETSRALYQIGLICREKRNRELERLVRKQYRTVRRALSLELRIELFRPLAILLAFALTFLAANRLFTMIFQYQDFSAWILPVELAVLGFIVTFVVYHLGEFLVRWFTEKTWTELDDIIVSVIIGPLSAVTVLITVMAATVVTSNQRPEFIKEITDLWEKFNDNDQIVLRSAVILILTWLAVYVFNFVAVHLLQRWAERTEQKYDDMFVRLFQMFGSFFIVATGLGVLLFNIQPAIK